jgi:HEAT repeat protein
VAASLGKYPDRRSETLALQFIGDLSLEVQLEAVHTTAAWPLEKAGPIMLAALEAPTYKTRKDAATQLSDRWPAAVGFPIDAPPERRAELVSQLQSQWTAQFGNIDQAAIAATAAGQPAEIPLARRREVVRWIDDLGNADASQAQQTAALESLTLLGADLPTVVEAILAEQRRPLPARLYHDVLPHCGKEFELAEQLSDENLQIRRGAIVELTTLSQQKTISLAAMTRIGELLAAEKDPISWIAAFKLIEHDPRQPAVLLASAGMSHPSPEVRRRACGYFAMYPDPARINLLLAALSDDNLSVLHAAAQALGEFPPPADTAPLEQLLSASDHSVRLDAAVSLARWNAPSGTAALERLAVDDDPAIRRKTAHAIGKLANSALLPVLIKLLDDQQDIRRAAIESLQGLTGSKSPPDDGGVHPASFNGTADGSQSDSGDTTSATLLQQAQLWKEWYKRQGH